jgi:hypothetical protein
VNAEIEEGHVSTALCHVGNISHRLGERTRTGEIRRLLGAGRFHPEVEPTFSRMTEHLKQNGVDTDRDRLTLGPLLEISSGRESFKNHPRADALLGREYRPPFTLPDEAQL